MDFTRAAPEIPDSLAGRTDQIFPTLTPAQIERITPHGHLRQVTRGEVLVEAGDQDVSFFVITKGQVQIVRAARARADAAQKEHNFLHSDAGYAHKTLPQPEYDRVMARYHANDEELAKAPAVLSEAMAKFNEWSTAYRNAGADRMYLQVLDLTDLDHLGLIAETVVPQLT